MVRRMRARAVAVLGLVLLGGCLWRGYARVLEIHLEVLQSMAAKMCALTAGPPPVSESMGEFVYPAKRARELQQQYTSRAGEPAYTAFGVLLDRYEGLAKTFDRSRNTEEAWAAAGPGVCEESRGIAEQANAVRRALAES